MQGPDIAAALDKPSLGINVSGRGVTIGQGNPKDMVINPIDLLSSGEDDLVPALSHFMQTEKFAGKFNAVP